MLPKSFYRIKVTEMVFAVPILGLSAYIRDYYVRYYYLFYFWIPQCWAWPLYVNCILHLDVKVQGNNCNTLGRPFDRHNSILSYRS